MKEEVRRSDRRRNRDIYRMGGEETHARPPHASWQRVMKTCVMPGIGHCKFMKQEQSWPDRWLTYFDPGIHATSHMLGLPCQRD
jgi:hypothetical protein